MLERTAYLAVKSFLLLSGYQLRMDRQTAVEFMVSIAEGKRMLEEMAEMLSQYSQLMQRCSPEQTTKPTGTGIWPDL